MSKRVNPITEAKKREQEARDKLAAAQLAEQQGQVHDSFIEELEKKAVDTAHNVKVKEAATVDTPAYKQELARRVLSRKHLLPFVMRTEPGYEPGWVHIDICQRLEKFMVDVENKKAPRLILQVPPRSGKSLLASVNFPAWALGHHPEWDIISTSYGASLAEGFSRKARDKVASPEFSTVFDARLNQDAKSVQSWKMDKGGTYNAAGVGGGIVGKGAHIGVIDDPFADKDAAWSEKNRESVWDWYTTAFYTRLAPGGGVLIIMQRWHEDDLAGRLIKRMEEDEYADQFDVVHYPAIAERDEKYRKKGEALHPERYNIQQLTQIRRNMHPADWEALYQQNPTMADGDFFKREMFHGYSPKDRPPLESLAIYQAWDLAIGTKEANDFSVGACVGVDENDNHYVLEVKAGRWSAFDLVEEILALSKRYKARTVGIEIGQIEMALGPLLNKRMRETKNFLHLERLKPGRRDKMMRARPLQGRMEQGMVLWPLAASWFQATQNEMLAFPAGKHDDRCLVAGTKIQTNSGQKNIEHVTTKDTVLSHDGKYHPVVAQAMTNEKADVLKLHLSNGTTLTGTGNHPILTTVGWVDMDALTCNHNVVVIYHQDQLDETSLVHKIERVGTAKVYNLTVADTHTYVANGIVTHNCDALSWIYLMLENMRTPYLPVAKKKKGWRDKMRSKRTSSGSGSAMTS